MLGWSVLVDARTPEERDSSEDKKSFLLATWETHLGGIDFLDSLVRKGKAKKLLSGGYPERYSALAADVLPLIPIRTPGPHHQVSHVTRHQDRIDACAPDQVLTIEAWDLS